MLSTDYSTRYKNNSWTTCAQLDTKLDMIDVAIGRMVD